MTARNVLDCDRCGTQRDIGQPTRFWLRIDSTDADGHRVTNEPHTTYHLCGECKRLFVRLLNGMDIAALKGRSG
jgi:hypothetical protein